MSRVLALALSAALALAALPARADDAADFMQRFSGEWMGSGQLLFGEGTHFGCELKGDPSTTRLSFDMTGRCWMGAFSMPVTARLRYNSETRAFYGAFLDGAKGAGVDIVGARKAEGVSLKLMREDAQGRLTAETVSPDQMKVMMFYRDPGSGRELPVVAMGFERKGTKVGLPDYMPPLVTGSVTARK